MAGWRDLNVDGCSIGKRGLLAWKVLLAITIQKKGIIRDNKDLQAFGVVWLGRDTIEEDVNFSSLKTIGY